MRSALVIALLVAVGCSSTKQWTKNMDPTSSAPANACGREPIVCPGSTPQCTTDANGCTTCTCLGSQPNNDFNIVNPRMDPTQR